MAKKQRPVTEAEPRNYELAQEAARACSELRGEDVLILDLRGLCSFADYFVIASAASHPQIKGIAREVEKTMADKKCRQIHRSGIDTGHWALLDYGDIVVHIFDGEMRGYYQLEDLWGDAPRIAI